MWNLMASNRVLDLKWKKQNQRKHLNTLRNIKSQVNNSAPKKYSFLNYKPKTRQLQFQRQVQIDVSNQKLVKKMLNVTSDLRKSDNIFFKDSLNSTFIKKVDRQIDENNQQLVRRLQSASSQYSKRCMKDYQKRYSKVKTNIASQRMDPFYDLQSALNISKQKNIDNKARPFSAR